MWSAEVELRQGRPEQALPFAYKALGFIKQVQQAERIYLARVGPALPPIDEGRRLGGDRAGLASRDLPLAARTPPAPAIVEAWQRLGHDTGAPDLDALATWQQRNAAYLPDALDLAAAIEQLRIEPGCHDCRQRLRAQLWRALQRPLPQAMRRSAAMNASAVNLWIALALALIVVIASVRQLRGNTAHPGRRWIVIALQIFVAALLYFCLVPPTRQQPAGGLVVLGTDAGKAGALPASEGPLLLLPEAADVAGAQRVPDLATALRQHPASTLTLVGAGLAARDRDALLPPDVRWQAAPEPRGWIALQPPADVAPGARFEVRAQANGVAHARAELLDPADSVVDRTDVADDGRVQLSGVARAEGRSVRPCRRRPCGCWSVPARPDRN
ncbi:hypothetical protein G6F31_013820 [Rhizopus arrhizus]|nr:hypothetical protein G6F31_013820 [Rhizopus arrhizus]